MRQFLIGNQAFDDSSPEFLPQLERAYEHKLRPLCQCREPPVPMYIARMDDQFLIKRMPLSGRQHDPGCPSYEPPYELSGLGPLIGHAIQVDAATGATMLKLDFSLSKRANRPTSTAPSDPPERVLSDAKKLSLRAMLHYLWDMGELTEWTSLWAGRRGWGRVRSSLQNAARQMIVRGAPLSDILFIPEVYQQEDKEGISARRAATLAGAKANGPGPRKLMLIIAEVKEFSPARNSQKILVRHLPFPLMIDEGAWKRLNGRYETELELWRSNEEFHLIVIATFGISSAGVASVEEVAMMVVNENWIPFENIYEQRLLERLSGLKRRSKKGLRFDLPRGQPIASVTLPDARPAPVALFIVPTNADEDYEVALSEMIAARPEMAPWIWRVVDGEMPRLP
ncbi:MULTISPECIES: DUF1173 domain-containing protein [Rhizobium]|uniref:DUF1173 domain-containing protein n=1 Tax=Rhizobium TaxID=379 RepID=UPI0007EA159F|nr:MULTISPECIES: DUF1173 domain-containing protein [Rhizobium]ANK95533.1 hypothetical protein AMK01_PD00654 [Rhizobium sp. N6212]ANL01585.1 hypothetical protein AMK00_PD00652 [Rhizobium sp. N621]ANL07713.1 hypothetical protein AMJ99_PD00659 [Rhizobium esperanzae]ANL13884.1 hypothetical protein AMJ98_PE00660 [Rhizobium sp. N1341]ANM38554.1 hypothetical protein AMK04_PD00660 [Rhizobium sp. N871]